MKNKILFVGLLSISVFIIAASPERSSSGAPGGHTGAPGEQTCATSGCHDDHSINIGTAHLNIEVGSSITDYSPGVTYPVKVSVSDAGIIRFGFQLVALNNASATNAGTFQIIDLGRTQKVKNMLEFADRDYVTYSFNGTDVTATNKSEWIVNWTAPSTYEGPITFYAAGVAANDDMTDKGDYVFTSNKVLRNLNSAK